MRGEYGNGTGWSYRSGRQDDYIALTGKGERVGLDWEHVVRVMDETPGCSRAPAWEQSIGGGTCWYLCVQSVLG